jgi:hypothetical protein
MASKTPILSEIQLVGGFFVECAVLNDAESPVLALQSKNQRYRIHHRVNPSFDVAAQDVLIDLAIFCQPLDSDGQEIAVQGRFRLHLTFYVAELASYLEPQGADLPDAPNQALILTLISVAYSTARGLITAKTNETVLQGFVLPLLDVRDLLKPETAE